MKPRNTQLALFAITAITSILLTGCAGLQPYPSHPGNVKNDLDQYAKYWKWDNYQATRAYEDEMVSARIASIDIFYRSYLASLYGGQKKYNLANDAAVLLLAGLGTLGAPTFDAISLKIISGTSGLLTGFKAKWDSELFYNTTLPTLIKTMNQNRESAMEEVEAHEGSNIYVRLRYVDKYFEAGSLITAINTLNATDTTEAGKRVLGLSR